MSDQSKVEVETAFRKVVECQVCGCVFSASAPRRFRGEGVTLDEASAAAALAAHDTIGRPFRGPCPSCGRLSPDEERRARRVRHWVVICPSLFAFFFVLWETRRRVLFTIDESAFLAAVVALTFGMTHAAVAYLGGRHHVKRTRARAARAVARGHLTVVRLGTQDDPGGVERARRLRLVAGLVVTVVAVALTLMAPVYRMANGWSVDHRLYPGVVGPGDEAWVFFDDEITTVNRHWRGEANAVVEYLVGGEVRKLEVPARSEDTLWDRDRIHARSENTRTHPRLWASITIPPDAPVGGKLRAKVGMTVTYPTAVEPGQFITKSMDVLTIQEHHLATPVAGRVYHRLLWWGVLGGSSLVVLLGIVLGETCYPAAPDSETTITVEPVLSSPPDVTCA